MLDLIEELDASRKQPPCPCVHVLLSLQPMLASSLLSVQMRKVHADQSRTIAIMWFPAEFLLRFALRHLSRTHLRHSYRFVWRHH